MEERLINRIIDHYLNSEEYNGIPIYSFDASERASLVKLLEKDLIEVLSANEDINPFIKRNAINIPKTVQEKYLLGPERSAVVYPSVKALTQIPHIGFPVYQCMLRSGEPQFKVIYFDTAIIQEYFDDPRFSVNDFGYRIDISGGIERLEDDDLLLAQYQEFSCGIAYNPNDQSVRKVGIFLRNLAKLPEKAQLRWMSYQTESQKLWRINRSFLGDFLYNDWSDKPHWVFDALLDELILANESCDLIGIPHVFNKTWTRCENDKLRDYHILFIPTRKRFDDFIVTIEKMVVGNISYDILLSTECFVRPVDRRDEDGNLRGSLQMLEDWLIKNTVGLEIIIKERIIKSFRNVRKLRQEPAHELYENDYNVNYFQEQEELVTAAFWAVHLTRMILDKHPAAKKHAIPEYLALDRESEIVFY